MTVSIYCIIYFVFIILRILYNCLRKLLLIKLKMAGNRGRNEDISNLDVVERFETYEDYLDSQLTANDMGYLEDEEMARQLVELGYRGLGDTLRREVR